MTRFRTLPILLVLTLAAAGAAPAQQKAYSDAPALVLTEAAVARINRILATDDFAIVFPTGVEARPQGCPNSSSNHCIWMCTGNAPLDDVDADTCSTDTYKCLGCGSDGGTVCQDGEGNTVPC